MSGLFQKLPHHLIHQNQAAGKVEGAFKGGTLGGRHGRLAVPAKITVPFSVFRIGKMLLTVVKGFIEPVQILFVFVSRYNIRDAIRISL